MRAVIDVSHSAFSQLSSVFCASHCASHSHLSPRLRTPQRCKTCTTPAMLDTRLRHPHFHVVFRSSNRNMVPIFPGEWARDLCGGAVWIPENTIRPSRRRTSLDQPGCTTARARDLLDSCVFHSSPAACAHYVHHGRCVYSMTSRTSHIRQNTELHLLECEGCCGAVSCACLEVKQRWTSHLTQVHRLASWSLGTLEPGARARAIDGRLTSHTQHFACRRLLDNRQANS